MIRASGTWIKKSTEKSRVNFSYCFNPTLYLLHVLYRLGVKNLRATMTVKYWSIIWRILLWRIISSCSFSEKNRDLHPSGECKGSVLWWSLYYAFEFQEPMYSSASLPLLLCLFLFFTICCRGYEQWREIEDLRSSDCSVWLTSLHACLCVFVLTLPHRYLVTEWRTSLLCAANLTVRR